MLALPAEIADQRTDEQECDGLIGRGAPPVTESVPLGRDLPRVVTTFEDEGGEIILSVDVLAETVADMECIRPHGSLRDA
jgi:hypothetical protein